MKKSILICWLSLRLLICRIWKVILALMDKVVVFIMDKCEPYVNPETVRAYKEAEKEVDREWQERLRRQGLPAADEGTRR